MQTLIMTTFHDLDPEDVSALQEALIILPQVTKGKRKVSGAFPTPPSSNISSSPSSSANSTTSTRFQDAAPASAPFEIPEKIESAASVEWCGFSPDPARVLFTRWTNRPDGADNPDDIVDYMRADIMLADGRNELSPCVVWV